ncbi:hypothetical protein EES44_18355 [Streptomyces sp. ADI96-15]|nr:hypothetical protein EES44_18355 [Streptomyces sp. ADI96-15]
MQAEPVGVPPRLLWQGDLGVERVALAPDGAEAAEDRTVGESGGGEALVQPTCVDLPGTAGGRPGVEARGFTVVIGGGRDRESGTGVP